MPGVSPDELAARMRAAGKSISTATVQRACRNGLGEKVGRSWWIPPAAADAFARDWVPYASLKQPKK